MTEEEMRQYIQGHPDRVNEPDQRGHLMLVNAFDANMSPAFIAWLLAQGADAKKGDEVESKSPLSVAKSAAVVDLLLKQGGETPCTRTGVATCPS